MRREQLTYPSHLAEVDKVVMEVGRQSLDHS